MAYDRKKFDEAVTKTLYSVKRGNKDGMDELFNNTFNHFYGYALVKLRDKAKAEDAVMTMYENVMKYIDSFDADKSGSGWMFTILKRIIYKINLEDKESLQRELPITDDSYLVDLNQMYETIELSNAVSGLDDVDKRIVFMYYFERMTLDESAETLGLSISAIHKRKQQILKKFRKFLV